MSTAERLVGLELVVVLGAIACGSSTPPPQAAANAAASSDLAALAAGPSGSAAPEPPSAPEVQAAIKAFDVGNYGDARRLLETATTKNPNDAGAFYDLGMVCEKLDDT